MKELTGGLSAHNIALTLAQAGGMIVVSCPRASGEQADDRIALRLTGRQPEQLNRRAEQEGTRRLSLPV